MSVELLKKLVGINSVFPEERELAFFLAGEIEKLGFEVEMQKFGTRYNVLAKKGEGKILLAGHMDTVPPYQYDRDPFTLIEEDGKLMGLGAFDMKAGIAAILLSAKNAESAKVMFVSDEENNSEGTYQAIKSGFLKGVEFALVPEVSDIENINKKTNTIMLGRRGRAQFEISVKGKSYHAAHLEKGVSAVTLGSLVAQEIEKMDLPKHEKLIGGNQFVREFYSKSTSLSVPENALLTVDRHLVFPENAESARKHIEERLDLINLNPTPKVKIVPREVPYLMPYITPQENQYVRSLGKTIQETLKVLPEYNYGMSVADENLIAMQGIAVASFGPIGSCEHSNLEWVSKQSYFELIEVMKNYMSSFTVSKQAME